MKKSYNEESDCFINCKTHEIFGILALCPTLLRK